MKAYILPGKDSKVQIGNKLFHIETGEVETVQANRTGLMQECLRCVEVPAKSMDGARLAIQRKRGRS